ncbi:hypothetical protein AUC68_05915 [Methyloceanibacter methanicus]|uniref:Cyclic nucleotide-binding domain-containing protein n=1 Tax=Methyloceanibacter methanicus TaxID=1774968 RepID=A0A1E3VZ13_9HYPH|nr:cyclic nucleotide-binding domain-containing protein [Methyloceanibacter methanicus]ODR98750.1 hypothetical protein AUC68_05915 [Methyloceanibacter methanicus]
MEIQVHDKPGKHKRVASIGPGLTFGEMALLDGGKRSADVIANEKVICYGLGVEELHELAEEHPNVMITILGNLTREFSDASGTPTRNSASWNRPSPYAAGAWTFSAVARGSLDGFKGTLSST